MPSDPADSLLDRLEQDLIHAIREACACLKPLAMLWSLGERDIAFRVASNAASVDEIIAKLATTNAPERAGRTMDNETEDVFERLRASGYM